MNAVAPRGGALSDGRPDVGDATRAMYREHRPEGGQLQDWAGWYNATEPAMAPTAAAVSGHAS